MCRLSHVVDARGRPHELSGALTQGLGSCKRWSDRSPRNVDELRPQASWRVALGELSALTLRSARASLPMDLVGVGDKAFSMSIGRPEPPGADRLSQDLSRTVRDWTFDPAQGSQWE